VLTLDGEPVAVDGTGDRGGEPATRGEMARSGCTKLDGFLRFGLGKQLDGFDLSCAKLAGTLRTDASLCAAVGPDCARSETRVASSPDGLVAASDVPRGADTGARRRVGIIDGRGCAAEVDAGTGTETGTTCDDAAAGLDATDGTATVGMGLVRGAEDGAGLLRRAEDNAGLSCKTGDPCSAARALPSPSSSPSP
jgi:hypothetical protein